MADYATPNRTPEGETTDHSSIPINLPPETPLNAQAFAKFLTREYQLPGTFVMIPTITPDFAADIPAKVQRLIELGCHFQETQASSKTGEVAVYYFELLLHANDYRSRLGTILRNHANPTYPQEELNPQVWEGIEGAKQQLINFLKNGKAFIAEHYTIRDLLKIRPDRLTHLDPLSEIFISVCAKDSMRASVSDDNVAQFFIHEIVPAITGQFSLESDLQDRESTYQLFAAICKGQYKQLVAQNIRDPEWTRLKEKLSRDFKTLLSRSEHDFGKHLFDEVFTCQLATAYEETKDKINTALKGGSGFAAAALLNEQHNLPLTKEHIVSICQIVSKQFQVEDYRELHDPANGIIMSRNSPRYRRLLSAYLRTCNDAEYLQWRKHYLASSSESESSNVLASMEEHGVNTQICRNFLSKAPSLHDATFTIATLIKVVPDSILSTLLDTSNGSCRKLLIFAKLFNAHTDQGRSTLEADLLSGKPLDDVIESAKIDLQKRVLPFAVNAQKTAETMYLGSAMFSRGRVASHVGYITQTLGQFSENLLKAVERTFSFGSGIFIGELGKRLSDLPFYKFASGVKDIIAELPATQPIEQYLTDPINILTQIFPRGLAATDVNIKDETLGSRYANINRGELRKAIYAKFGTAASDPALTATGLISLLTNTPGASDEVAALFSERGISIPRVRIRIAPKSDPNAWTAGDQVVCCAGWGQENHNDFMERNDCAFLLVEQDDRVVAFSPLWKGEDQKTIIVNNIEIAGPYTSDERDYRNLIRDFLSAYATGGIPPLIQDQTIKTYSRVTIGTKSGDVSLDDLPIVPVIRPIGIDEDTRGTWNKGHTDADKEQRLLWTA